MADELWDTMERYAYGAGDPVNNSDPTGLASYAFDGTWNDRDKMKNVTNTRHTHSSTTSSRASILSTTALGERAKSEAI